MRPPDADQWMRITLAARTLSERPDLAFDQDRLDRWCATAARGDHDAFAERLAALRPADNRNPADDPAGNQLPAWTRPLREAAKGLRDHKPARHDRDAGDGAWQTLASRGPDTYLRSETVLAELLEPFVSQAFQDLRASTTLPTWLSEPAVADLASGLRQRLARLIETCADTEFHRFVGALPHESLANAWPAWTGDLLDDGLLEIWARYPVLARLVGTTICLWVERTRELLERLDRDWAVIERDLAETSLHSVTGIRNTLSDPHDGHSTVAVIEFDGTAATGTRAVYKPRDLRIERIWNDVVAWANEHGLDLGPPLRVLRGDRYGWVEFADAAPVDSPAAAAHFYRRIGTLGALLFALGGNDFHAENLIARGTGPVIIDAETSLQPVLVEEDRSPGRTPALATDSVIDQLILPRWLRVGGRCLDLSAVGAGARSGWGGVALRWRSAGTHEASLVRREIPGTPMPSSLQVAGIGPALPEDHAAEIQSGFRRGWLAIARHAEHLLAGPLADVDPVEVRVLVRMTHTYSRILETSMQPSLLRDGIDRSIHLDHVARSLLDRDDHPQSLPVADAERDQLEAADIPRFVVRADATALVTPTGDVALPFAESGAARMRRRIAMIADPQLTDAELARQLRLVAASLAVAPVGVRTRELARLQFAAAGQPSHEPPSSIDVERVREAANALADDIVGHLDSATGRPLGLVGAGAAQWAIDLPGPGSYDGCAGIGLALVAGARALDRPDLAATASTIMAPALADALRRPRRLWLAHGIGGQDGVGGLLHAWSTAITVGGLDSSDDVVAAMTALLAAYDPGDVRGESGPGSHPGHDLLTGGLGLLAGLMAAQSTGADVPADLRDAATTSVVHSVEDGLEKHNGGGATGINGFSHGDSGVAVVLLGAAELGWCEQPKAVELAEACLRAESDRYDPALRDWPDLRPGADPTGPGPGWCNGLPGIAMARGVVADRFGFVAPDTVAHDLARATPGLEHDVAARDNLCCGTAGRAEILRLLARTRPSLASVHRAPITDLATRSTTNRLRAGVPPDCPIRALGLFQGISGVLVALAGALRPDLPDLLTWLPPPGPHPGNPCQAK